MSNGSTPNFNIPLVQTPDPDLNPNGQAALMTIQNYAPADQVNAALVALDSALATVRALIG